MQKQKLLLAFVTLFFLVNVASSSLLKAEDNLAEEVSVSMFPNPVTSGLLTIKSEQEITQVQIINIVGQPVLDTEVESQQEIKIDVSDFQNGMYLVRVTFTNDKQYTSRILVK